MCYVSKNNVKSLDKTACTELFVWHCLSMASSLLLGVLVIQPKIERLMELLIHQSLVFTAEGTPQL